MLQWWAFYHWSRSSLFEYPLRWTLSCFCVQTKKKRRAQKVFFPFMTIEWHSFSTQCLALDHQPAAGAIHPKQRQIASRVYHHTTNVALRQSQSANREYRHAAKQSQSAMHEYRHERKLLQSANRQSRYTRKQSQSANLEFRHTRKQGPSASRECRRPPFSHLLPGRRAAERRTASRGAISAAARTWKRIRLRKKPRRRGRTRMSGSLMKMIGGGAGWEPIWTLKLGFSQRADTIRDYPSRF